MTLARVVINNTVSNLYSASLTKEGERAVDQMRISIPKSTTITVNQEIRYVQDMISLARLMAIYNFQGNTEDESGFAHHGTASNITYGNDLWGGKSGLFNGTSTNVTVAHSTAFDFSSQFDILIWAKWTSTTTGMYLLSKRVEGDVFQDNVYQDNVFTTSGDNGILIQANAASAGDVRVQVGGNVITSSTAGYNDGEWHLIRVSRNRDNLVTLSIDTLSKGTTTTTVNATTTESLTIGSDFYGNYFNGEIARVRIYNDIIDNAGESSIYSERNPRSVIKFGGKITKIDSDLVKTDLVAQSFGKILAETEINGTVFTNRTPEYIVETLVEDKTDLTYSSSSSASGITLSQYTADGKLIDILKDLAALTNRVFYTTGSKLLVFDDASFNDLSLVLKHGTDVRIEDDGYDDTEVVNDLTVLGQNLMYSTIDTFNGNNSDTVFTLDNNPVVVKVSVGGVEKTPEEDYDFDTMARTITFATAPATGSNNISVEYDFERPLYIRGVRETSITTYGRHAKKLNLPWISTKADGIRFVQSYLNRYKDISRKVKVESGRLLNSLQENDIVHLTNTEKAIDDDFVIKSIQWTYPQLKTEIDVGEYYFDFFEYDKEIVAKIHDLESAITRVKDVREYESPEETITLADAIDMRIDKFKLTESLSMTDTPNIYDKIYNSYSQGSITITFQPSIFQSNVFTVTGRTSSSTAATYGSRITGACYVSG
tara:strand:+ start:1351 stop:3489 length:2139 start_codon:yes stop_codon:yes gene_type:complete